MPRPARLVAGVGVLLVLLAVGSPPTRAQQVVAFSGVAEGRLVATNFTLVPGIIFPQLVDGGSSVAQAELSSLGDSRAFASDPYPSESVVLLPGLVAGLTSGATSGVVPDYPLFASSSFPAAPEQRVELASVVLEATSGADRSSGAAANGLNESTASVTRDASGVVTAHAETAAATIRLSSLLSLDGVRSTAVARKAPDGEVELSSSFELGALVVAGQRLRLSDLLALPSQQVDVGSTVAGLLLDQLAGEGTTIDVVPAEETEDSVTSAGLRIRLVTPAPDLPPLPPIPDPGLGAVPGLPAILALPGGLSGVEHVVTEVVIGQATARVDARALPGPDAGGRGEVGGPTGVPVGGPVGGGAFPSLPPSAPGPAAPSTPEGQVPAASFGIADLESTPFYGVLLLAGVACVGTSVLIGKLGVREP